MLFDFETTENNDISKIRSITLKDGQVITLYRDDAYGLISVKFLKGRVPNTLAGQFTSYPEAEKAVQLYISTTGKEFN